MGRNPVCSYPETLISYSSCLKSIDTFRQGASEGAEKKGELSGNADPWLNFMPARPDSSFHVANVNLGDW